MRVRIPPRAPVIRAAVVCSIAAALAASACTSDGTDTSTGTTSRVAEERRVAEAWSDKARVAYEPLELTALELPTRVRAWAAGERSDEQLRADLDVSLGEVKTVREKVLALPPFRRDQRVGSLYWYSSLLYVDYVHALRAALAQPPGPVREQLGLVARRLRVLGDRVFDRGQERLARFLHETPDPNVEVRLPPEVPDWEADGIAAGPPLADPPPPAATTPALREETRPTQPRPAWAARVAAAGVPGPTELPAALDAGDEARLRDLARRFDALARDLAAVADPAGATGREEAVQVRLALLAYAEAARVVRLGLPGSARRLTLIGDALWVVPGLPGRESGLAPALLAEDDP